MQDFVHLHVHTQYSLLDGQASVSRLVDKAMKDGMKGIAITDHGNMFGIKEFYNYVNKKNSGPKGEIKDLKKKIAALESGKAESENPEAELAACRLSDLGPAMAGSWELTRVVLQMMSDTCDYLSRLVKRAYLYDRRERLAAFLLEQTATDNPDKGVVDGALPYTHEDLALVVGLSRVTVTRVLGEFQSNGWVECGYRHIRVRDRDGLHSVLARFPERIP